jgi:hypothetical protein
MNAEAITNDDAPPESDASAPKKVRITYNDGITRQFVFASVLWGVVGMLVGVLAALQMAFRPANIDPHLAFGRLRPLHTNAVIFAFVGNMMFAGVYYSTQRLCKARMASTSSRSIHFWGWQLIIVAAAITLPLGFTRGKEYAELDLADQHRRGVIWVVFAMNFFWTLAKRNEKHLYVALWFYIATIVTVAMLYIVNHLSIPTSLGSQLSVFGGVQDALVQWWYGHNAVAFFLTTPDPRASCTTSCRRRRSGRSTPTGSPSSTSGRWSSSTSGRARTTCSTPRCPTGADPRHVLLAHALGPSWGGMLNGLLTLRGAWDKLRTDPVSSSSSPASPSTAWPPSRGRCSRSARSTPSPTTPTGSSATCTRRPRLERLHGRRHVLLARPAPLGHEAHSTSARELPLLDRHHRHPPLRRLDVGRRHHAGPHAGAPPTPDGALQYPNFVETLIAIRLMYWARLDRRHALPRRLRPPHGVNLWNDRPLGQGRQRRPARSFEIPPPRRRAMDQASPSATPVALTS